MSPVGLRFGTADGARVEDRALLSGEGRFTDDVDAPGQAHAAFARSAVGHGVLRAVDVAAARAMPGVITVLTGADLAADGLGPIPPVAVFPGRDGKPMTVAPMPVLAHARVRHVGEPIAIVVAETRAAAEDAAEAVAAEIEALPAAVDVEAATATGAPLLWPDAPGNVSLDWADGDQAAVDAAFARAAHVVHVRLADTRIAAVAMEPRAGIGAWDAATGRYTLTASTQGVAVVRKLLAEGVFRVPPEQIRVVTHDVGGGFGMKVQAYPEYAAILHAARKVGRPVKWRNSRLESFLTDTHGRDGVLEASLALDADGRFLALRMDNRVGIGAYTSTFAAIFSTNNTKNCLSSVYAIPAIGIGVKMVLTNAVALGPYRGAGRPEAIYAVERLIDEAARTTGIDRIALRRRNMIPPTAMPYRAANGQVYDSGEFERVMDRALDLADWSGFATRRARSAADGKLRGIGLCCFLEVAGGILEEVADLRFAEDGMVELRIGAQPMGQGQQTTFPRILAARLGVPADRIRLVQGDSDAVPAGTPTVASRSTMMGGGAAAVACDAAIAKGREAAGHLLEAATADIEFVAGDFRVAGTDRQIGLLEVARRARTLPGFAATGLDSREKFTSPQMSFPNGCHVCEVEIDPETGVVQVMGYAAVDDVGTIVHETIVEGQIHGGVVQGLGQVLGEQIVYAPDGQMLTASFMDYVMPRADDMPALRIAHHIVPCTTNPLGVKGAGESGVAGALPAAMNAIVDALSARGITRFDMPATPQRIWRALREAR